MSQHPPYDKQRIRILQAQWEYWVLKTSKNSTFQVYSRALESFLSHYPDKHNPEDFYKGDMDDYAIAQDVAGVDPRYINQVINVVHGFWKWLIEYKDLPMGNIATTKKLRFVPKQKNRITLKEFMRLCSEINDPLVAKGVELVLLGKTSQEIKAETGYQVLTIAGKFRPIARRARVKVSLTGLPRAVHQAALNLLVPSLPQELLSPEVLQQSQSHFEAASSLPQ